MKKNNNITKNCAPKKATMPVQDAVAITAQEAIKANCQGTFSVGGLLMDIDGNIIRSMHNNVVLNDKANDPTAHGERQMVDWYYENRKTLKLPDPENIILVTSLDPCCMCTGSILEAGFKLAVISANDDYAGINFDSSATFPTLENTPMHEQIKSVFSYPEVAGETCYSRKASGAELSETFTGKIIDEQTNALCTTSLYANLIEVRDKINNDVEPDELIDPATLSSQSPIYQALKQAYPNALEYTAETPGVPDAGLAKYLKSAMDIDIKNGGDGDAIAFLDYFGNLLLCLPGNYNNSAIKTPFMQTTRAYTKLKYDLQMAEVPETLNYLCHPKYGTFIRAKSPQINPLGLVDFGAFGSTMEGAMPPGDHLQYVIERVPQAELQAFCDKLPPFYSSVDSVNLRIRQVESQELIDALTN